MKAKDDLSKDIKIKFYNETMLKQSQNVIKSTAFIIILGNIFALLPVEGILNQKQGLRFTLKTWKVVYVAVILMAAAFMLVVGITYLFQKSSFEVIGRSAWSPKYSCY